MLKIEKEWFYSIIAVDLRILKYKAILKYRRFLKIAEIISREIVASFK